MSNRYKNTLAFVNADITSVKVTFDNTAKQYTYKVKKSVASYLKVDDYVVVESDEDRKFVIGKVVFIDQFTDISPDSDTDYKWVVSRVDAEELEQTM